MGCEMSGLLLGCGVELLLSGGFHGTMNREVEDGQVARDEAGRRGLFAHGLEKGFVPILNDACLKEEGAGDEGQQQQRSSHGAAQSPKFAVSVMPTFMSTVILGEDEVTAPVQPRNFFLVLGVAVMETSLPTSR